MLRHVGQAESRDGREVCDADQVERLARVRAVLVVEVPEVLLQILSRRRAGLLLGVAVPEEPEGERAYGLAARRAVPGLRGVSQTCAAGDCVAVTGGIDGELAAESGGNAAGEDFLALTRWRSGSLPRSAKVASSVPERDRHLVSARCVLPGLGLPCAVPHG